MRTESVTCGCTDRPDKSTGRLKIQPFCIGTREAKLECIVARLQQMKAAKPRTVITLGSTIYALFKKQIEEMEIEALIKALEKRTIISIEDSKISYSWPAP